MILEDNAVDVILLKGALRKADLDFTALLFEDGESAFKYINTDARPSKPRLDAAILDLNVPGRDGSEVLAQIRQSPELKHIVAIIFSSLPKAVMISRAVHADCYITKPSDLNQYLALGQEMRLCIGDCSRRDAMAV